MSIASLEELVRYREAIGTLRIFDGKLSQDRWASLALATFPSYCLQAGSLGPAASILHLASLAACLAAFAIASRYSFGVEIEGDSLQDAADLIDWRDRGHILASAALGLAFAAYLAGIAAFAWARP